MTGQYSKLETPEAQLEYLLLSVCRSRTTKLPAPSAQDFSDSRLPGPQRRARHNDE